MFSMEPNSARSLMAVFFPIPWTPLMLSEESPQRPLKSGTCLGVTSIFSRTMSWS